MLRAVWIGEPGQAGHVWLSERRQRAGDEYCWYSYADGFEGAAVMCRRCDFELVGHE